MFMKKLVSIFVVFVPIAILFSCYPDQAEGNPLIKNDGSIIDAPIESSSSLDSDDSSSSEEPSSSSILISSCSSSLRSSSSVDASSSSSSLRSSSSSVVVPSSSSSLRSSSSLSSSSGINYSYGSLVYGGQTYKTVKIGTQTWMAENLNYNVSGSLCYDNNSANCAIYGRLYNWSAAISACPTGWHLPTQAQWDVLSNYVGGSNVEGMHLKATSGWNSNGNGLNTYGFAALPGGDGGYSDGFSSAGVGGGWWSASENGSNAYYKYMFYNYDGADWTIDGKIYMFSVRCLQN
jgi:uncharacterized protein (TIGR02145 family)